MALTERRCAADGKVKGTPFLGQYIAGHHKTCVRLGNHERFRMSGNPVLDYTAEMRQHREY